MADPISGGIGKASQQMMQEMQRQAQELAKQQAEGVDKAGFQDNMVQKVQDVKPVQEVQKASEATKSVDVLKAAQLQSSPGVQGTDATRLGVKPVEAAQGTERPGINKLLDQIVGGQNKLDDIINMACSGRKYNQQDLLAIQASVYKFSQELELTSKVVEKATSGIKQTMQTQV